MTASTEFKTPKGATVSLRLENGLVSATVNGKPAGWADEKTGTTYLVALPSMNVKAEVAAADVAAVKAIFDAQREWLKQDYLNSDERRHEDMRARMYSPRSIH